MILTIVGRIDVAHGRLAADTFPDEASVVLCPVVLLPLSTGNASLSMYQVCIFLLHGGISLVAHGRLVID